MKVLVSGGNGRFSNEIKKHNSSIRFFFIGKEELDILNPESVEKSILKYKPDIFLHTAALSRPMRIHDENPEKSIRLNIIGTSNCVISCIRHNIKFVYLSTDFVYPGDSGNYRETDGVYPFNKYAWSKLGGECSCMMYDNSLILRMSMVENNFPHTKAFSDSFRSNIWHKEAVTFLISLLKSDARGIYNVGGGRKSVYEFVKEKNPTIKSESIENCPFEAPSDISMNTDKLNKKLSSESDYFDQDI